MENYIKYETAKEIFGCDFEENEIVAYDIGNGNNEDFPITAKCWDEEENLWWFGSEGYDCAYDFETLTDKTLVKIA